MLGVETNMTPSSLISEHTVKYASPVPGGISIKSTSRSPQSVVVMSCIIALLSIGPRQIAALSESIIEPIVAISILLNVIGLNIFFEFLEINSGLILLILKRMC